MVYNNKKVAYNIDQPENYSQICEHLLLLKNNLNPPNINPEEILLWKYYLNVRNVIHDL